MHSRTRRLAGSIALVLALGLGVITPASIAGAAPPPSDDVFSEPTWVNGKVARFELTFAGEAASDARETMFVVGPQDEANPQEHPHGQSPAHDHVMNHIPYGQRPTCHVWSVMANDGPFTERVRTRDSGLVYEVDLGQGFVALVSTDVVTEALVQGLVRLEDEGFPDFVCWTTRQP